MNTLEIIKIGIPEVAQLQAIGRQTFAETFAAGNTEENLKKYLEEGFTLEKLTAEVANAHSAFYFAKLGTQVIGYLKVNFGQAQTELKDSQSLEIERIYVLAAFHGKQVGQCLYDKALAIARETDAHYVWLGVWEENPRAIRFYQKNGFEAFGKHTFVLGDDAQTDIMMRLQLRGMES
jgi:diamine N-acetyltransferase